MDSERQLTNRRKRPSTEKGEGLRSYRNESKRGPFDVPAAVTMVAREKAKIAEYNGWNWVASKPS